ncbi:hypothetical protein CY34DRAFT_809869 [Suillus luteus UH-Slu-Lm8-n1]|uniref:Uncharacterized protein n=1 Tax=Suillus luteus UH-Slu-Lm8-n1 TaxID=930992 RepID=A0A0D0A8D0_9AGAM|nr:hypothetical protein CY34DRAFT_809869 [Suillus luteus UH-Slu-Lm8-n1]
MSVNHPPALALSQLSGTSRNQRSPSYPVLKYKETERKRMNRATPSRGSPLSGMSMAG